MEITLNTPALLFPAISLILLAYTNRFLGLATLVRNLSRDYRLRQSDTLLGQIHQLRHRLLLIRNMQAFGVASLLACVVCMFVLFAGFVATAKIIFALSLVLMTLSLAISLREIQLSVGALNLELSDLEKKA
jgi:hypothetical protein